MKFLIRERWDGPLLDGLGQPGMQSWCRRCAAPARARWRGEPRHLENACCGSAPWRDGRRRPASLALRARRRAWGRKGGRAAWTAECRAQRAATISARREDRRRRLP